MSEDQSTSLSALRPAAAASLPAVRMGFGDSHSFELLQRAAKMLAASSLVPASFQGNIGNCAIALNMALRMGADPIMVAQNLYIVYGRPAWSSKFLVATVNSCGRFSALRYEFQGDENSDAWGCRAWALERETGERLDGPLITIKLAKDEGWYGKKDSKWKTMPEQMLRYRAAGWWTNVYAPEVAMGLRTDDEERDAFDARQGPDGTYSVSLTAEQTKGASITVDPSTGEIIDAPAMTATEVLRRQRQARPVSKPEPEPEPEQEAKPSQYAIIKRYIPTASNVDAVNESLDLLRDLKTPGDITEEERAELVQLAAARVSELTGGAE